MDMFMHYFTMVAPFLVASFLPSLITGLSMFPKTEGVVKYLKKALDLLSFATHLDSSGTFKLPLTFSKAPEKK